MKIKEKILAIIIIIVFVVSIGGLTYKCFSNNLSHKHLAVIHGKNHPLSSFK